MPTPSAASSTSAVPLSNDPRIDALLGLLKWGGAAGTGTSLSFSFPWTAGATATFSGYNGAAYSSLHEDTAASHYGLNPIQIAAARNALAQWSSVANIAFTEVADTSAQVGDIRFGFTSALQALSTVWGWSKFPNAYWPSGGDIWISTVVDRNADKEWSVGSRNYSSLLHEIGHSLGLKHPFDSSPTLPAAEATDQFSVMSYAGAAHSLFVRVVRSAGGEAVSWQSFEVQPEGPMLLDIAAIQYLYGANMTWRTGNDLYTFDPATPFLKTIWDAGGTDTISVDNFSRGCTIDLRPGQFSSIAIPSDSIAGVNWQSPPPAATYDGTDNLAIAFGATIENAIGGSGNDILRGNDVANALDGGAGNDTLWGGAGNDLFDGGANRRAGSDVFYGGQGDDTFHLTYGDVVVEYLGEGTDTVWAGFSYAAGENVENVFAAASGGVSLSGNGGDNLLRGAAGNDILSGGAGNDTVLYDGLSSSYLITGTDIGHTISGGATGTDVLTGIEFVQFADRRVGLLHLIAPVDLAFSASAPNEVAVRGDVVVSFCDPIALGAGQIVLKTAGGAVVASYDASSSLDLSVSGSTLTIHPEAELAGNTDYLLVFGAGSLRDLDGNSYAGTASYNFTTVVAGAPMAGTVGADNLIGSASADTLQAGTGNDALRGLGGNDRLDGGGGLDTAWYGGGMASYAIARAGAGFTVSGPEGFDTLVGVERIKFADFNLAFDVDGNAGMAFRLYRAAFDRTPDERGLGFWISALDAGASLPLVAQSFIDSAEFNARAGNVASEQYVGYLYQNVLHRAADPGGLTFWVDHLNAGNLSRAQTLVGFSESPENQAEIVGLVQNGMVYTG